MTPLMAIVERIPRSFLYDVHFIRSIGSDGRIVCLNPNKTIGDEGHNFLMRDTDEFPEGTALRLTRAKLEALLVTPDEELGEFSLNLAVKKAYHQLVHCRKCGEKL